MSAYDGSSPILGNGRATPEQIQAFMEARGRALAADYAPDGQYQAPPAGLGQTIIGECRRWKGMNGLTVNWDLVAGQIADETAGWQSKYARERNNPGGIGAINSAPDEALTFVTPAEGVRAHVAHLLTYAVGSGPWQQYDPRYLAVVNAGWLGVVHVLSDLNGRWAYPGTTYGQSIADLANQLLATTGGAMTVDISGFVQPSVEVQWFPVNGTSYLGEPMEIHGVCIHETGNTSPGAEAQQNVDYMNTAECISRQASWHATVGLTKVIQTIPGDKQAFHASDGGGPGNTHFYAIEGVMCYPPGTANFLRVLQNHAWYAAYVLRYYNLPFQWTGAPDGTVAQHNTFARDHKDCPQFYRDAGLWDTFLAYARAFYDAGAPAAAPAANPLFVPETGKWWQPEFYDYYQAHGGLAQFGYPLSGAFLEDGLLVQYSERATFELHPENQGTPYYVLLRRLGADALSSRYPTGAPA